MKWYQLHLSTLLVLMVLAGVFVWLNINGQEWIWHPVVLVRITGGTEMVVIRHGWPLPFDRTCDVTAFGYYEWNWTPFILDLAVCLLLLGLAGAGIEWATRRMKPKPTP